MDQKIEIINNWNLSKFFREMETGTIKIPRFQRGYVWEKSKVVKLLNSIYHQYPIGSFFLWYAPKEYKNYIREIGELGLPDQTDANYFQFILDGQQRITSLYVTLKGKVFDETDYRTICFDIENKEFIATKNGKGRNLVPAWKLFDNIAFGEILSDYAITDRKKKTNFAAILRDCSEIFTNYPLSIVRTINNDLDDVVEIFERINQGGKRLTSFDLVQATTWSPQFDLNQNIADFNARKEVVKYGTIDVKIFITALSINILGNYNNSLQLQLTSENCKKHWKSTADALLAALNFVADMGIKDDYEPYHPLVAVMQYYFYKLEAKKAKDGHKRDIEKWFWDSKFSGRYSSSSTTSVFREDIQKIDNLLNSFE